jgi:hypothetical protein
MRVTAPRNRPDRQAWFQLRLSFPACCLALLLVTPLGFTAGCYSGDALLEKARSAAQRTRLAEIDLGKFRTTMPKDPESNSFTELELHLFGTVPRYRVPTIERQLRMEDYRLRHEMIAAVRQASVAELAEPNLTQLRTRIEKIVNGILEESPVDTIGFYSVQVDYR